MPFVVVCPECDAQLKSNALIAAGRTITCPSCKTKFTTERDSKEIGGGSKASVSVPPAPKPKPKPSRDEEEDFEDEDERPVKKKVKASRDEDEEEEDERPKKKVSKNRDYEDEDENDRPKKKVSKNRDYDDDEDDDEDRPRHKKKGKKKPQKSKLPWILGLAGGGGIALLGILTLVLFLTDTFPFNKKEDKKVVNNPPQGGGPNNPNPPSGSSGNVVLDVLRYAPSNIQTAIFIDIEKVRLDSILGPAANKLADEFTFGVLTADEVGRVGVFLTGKEKESGVLVIQIRPSFNRANFDQKIGKQPSLLNGVSVYETETGITYFGDPSTLVIGPKAVLLPILGKPQTPNANLQEFAQGATGVFRFIQQKLLLRTDQPILLSRLINYRGMRTPKSQNFNGHGSAGALSNLIVR